MSQERNGTDMWSWYLHGTVTALSQDLASEMAVTVVVMALTEIGPNGIVMSLKNHHITITHVMSV